MDENNLKRENNVKNEILEQKNLTFIGSERTEPGSQIMNVVIKTMVEISHLEQRFLLLSSSVSMLEYFCANKF